MQPSEIYNLLKQQDFADKILSFEETAIQPGITVDPWYLEDICYFLRDDERTALTSLSCLSGMDYGAGKDLGVVYHLNSMKHNHSFVIKVRLSRETPKVPTIEHIFKAANWHEREAFDLYGIVFENHPDLRRILCPDDWEGFPLRKDYKVAEYYHGVKVPY